MLERLASLIEYLPNAEILFQALGIRESKASNEIENIVTTNDEI